MYYYLLAEPSSNRAIRLADCSDNLFMAGEYKAIGIGIRQGDGELVYGWGTVVQSVDHSERVVQLGGFCDFYVHGEWQGFQLGAGQRECRGARVGAVLSVVGGGVGVSGSVEVLG